MSVAFCFIIPLPVIIAATAFFKPMIRYIYTKIFHLLPTASIGAENLRNALVRPSAFASATLDQYSVVRIHGRKLWDNRVSTMLATAFIKRRSVVIAGSSP